MTRTRSRWLPLVGTALLLLTALRSAPAAAQTPVIGPNLLNNPRFDFPYYHQVDICGTYQTLEEVQVPVGWSGYWTCQKRTDLITDNRRPEFRMVESQANPGRVFSPPTALRYFNFWGNNQSSGVYQVVPNLRTGSRYRFSIWAQLWSSNSDIQPPSSSVDPGDLAVRVCIDTLGRAGVPDFSSPAIRCGDWVREYDQYVSLWIDAYAAAPRLTVILNTTSKMPVKHNDVHGDDAELVEVFTDAALPVRGATPVPTPTPVPAVDRYVIEDNPELSVQTAGSWLNVRAQPGLDAKAYRQVSDGSAMLAVGASADGAWWRILTPDGEHLGWVSKRWVEPNGTVLKLAAAPEPRVIIVRPIVNVRAQPSLSARVYRQVNAGAVYVPVSKSADGWWWKVKSAADPGGFAWLYAPVVFSTAAADSLPIE